MSQQQTGTNMTVGIVGGGFVGNILKQYYPEAKVYDINGKFDSIESTLSQEVIFIAFNLKNNGLNEEGFKEIAEYPSKAPDNRIFIIKSTFIPGTCDRLQKEFPQHKFIYNPEFLTEVTAWWDFTKPWCQIVGCAIEDQKLIHDIVFPLLPDAPVKKIMKSSEAEMLKHLTNTYYSTKVVLFNEMYNICKEKGIDYEPIREIMIQDRRIGDSHSIINHDGYRGYGGKCLPKDIEALSKYSGNELFDYIIKRNDKLKEDDIKK